MKIKQNIVCVIATLILLQLFVGCTSTYQMRKVEPSGFLQDIDQLEKGNKDQPKLVYVDKSVHFKKYTKVMMDPVSAYGSNEEGSLKDLSKKDQKMLLNYYDAALRRELSKSYELVDEPGPGVLKLRVAVTDARGSKVVLDTISSVIPIGMAVSAVKAIVTGKHLSVGNVATEYELLDAQSGKRLAAAVDARIGRKYTAKFDKWKKWSTAEDAFDYWSEIIHTRLKELSK